MNQTLEGSRVAGVRVAGGRVAELRNPYDGDVVALIAQAGADDARRALEHAAAYRPRLSRHRRSEILLAAAAALQARAADVAALITHESGLRAWEFFRYVPANLSCIRQDSGHDEAT